MTKFGCSTCGWRGINVLTAESPFVEFGILRACPVCRNVTLFLICEVEGCTKEATCGTLTAEGVYMWCCMEHFDEIAGANKEEE